MFVTIMNLSEPVAGNEFVKVVARCEATFKVMLVLLGELKCLTDPFLEVQVILILLQDYATAMMHWHVSLVSTALD